ncbi:MAG: DsrE family protein [Desulfobacteria bacterium]
MAETKEEKIVIIGTHGGEDPDRASLPFVVANAAMAMDVKTTVILQGEAVTLAVKGAGRNTQGIGFPPLKELMASYFGQGGKLLLCTPCVKGRNIAADTLVEEASLIAGARVVQECLEAKATLNY